MKVSVEYQAQWTIKTRNRRKAKKEGNTSKRNGGKKKKKKQNRDTKRTIKCNNL